MVIKQINVSAYSGRFPSPDSTDLIIHDGPLYDSKQVLSLLNKGDNNTIPWTRRCKADLQRMSFDIADARALIKDALRSGQYLNSQWCEQKPSGPWAACDAYRLVRDEWNEYAHKEFRIEYYVKFAIGKTGKILLLISCHLSTSIRRLDNDE